MIYHQEAFSLNTHFVTYNLYWSNAVQRKLKVYTLNYMNEHFLQQYYIAIILFYGFFKGTRGVKECKRVQILVPCWAP